NGRMQLNTISRRLFHQHHHVFGSFPKLFRRSDQQTVYTVFVSHEFIAASWMVTDQSGLICIDQKALLLGDVYFTEILLIEIIPKNLVLTKTKKTSAFGEHLLFFQFLISTVGIVGCIHLQNFFLNYLALLLVGQGQGIQTKV